MNNNVEKLLFWISNVKWLHLTYKVDKFIWCSCQIFSGFNIAKVIKICQFLHSYSKIKRWTFFGTQGGNIKLQVKINKTNKQEFKQT